MEQSLVLIRSKFLGGVEIGPLVPPALLIKRLLFFPWTQSRLDGCRSLQICISPQLRPNGMYGKFGTVGQRVNYTNHIVLTWPWCPVKCSSWFWQLCTTVGLSFSHETWFEIFLFIGWKILDGIFFEVPCSFICKCRVCRGPFIQQPLF